MIMNRNLKEQVNVKLIVKTVCKNLKIKIRNYPFETLIQPIVTSLLTIIGAYLMYTYLFLNQISETFKEYTNTGDYLSYIILGSIVFVFTTSSISNTSRGLITEMRSGTFESIFLTKLSLTSFLIANMIERLIFILFEVTGLIILSLPFGLNIKSFNLTTLIVALSLTLISIYSLSILVWGLMIFFRDTMNILNIIIITLNLLCGLVFPIQYLPMLIQKVSQIIPVTHSINILRTTLLSGGTIASQSTSFIALTILTVIYFIISSLIANTILKRQLNENVI